MRHIDLNEAKLHFVDLIDVALGGEEIVITHNDQPVLKLVPIVIPSVRRQAGSARGLMTIARDFDAPLEDFRAYLQ